MTWFPQPKYRHVFKLTDGSSILADPRDVVKTMNRRSALMPPVRVFEIKTNGVVRQLWPEDILTWDQEPV